MPLLIDSQDVHPRNTTHNKPNDLGKRAMHGGKNERNFGNIQYNQSLDKNYRHNKNFKNTYNTKLINPKINLKNETVQSRSQMQRPTHIIHNNNFITLTNNQTIFKNYNNILMQPSTKINSSTVNNQNSNKPFSQSLTKNINREGLNWNKERINSTNRIRDQAFPKNAVNSNHLTKLTLASKHTNNNYDNSENKYKIRSINSPLVRASSNLSNSTLGNLSNKHLIENSDQEIKSIGKSRKSQKSIESGLNYRYDVSLSRNGSTKSNRSRQNLMKNEFESTKKFPISRHNLKKQRIVTNPHQRKSFNTLLKNNQHLIGQGTKREYNFMYQNGNRNRINVNKNLHEKKFASIEKNEPMANINYQNKRGTFDQTLRNDQRNRNKGNSFNDILKNANPIKKEQSYEHIGLRDRVKNNRDHFRNDRWKETVRAQEPNSYKQKKKNLIPYEDKRFEDAQKKFKNEWENKTNKQKTGNHRALTDPTKYYLFIKMNKILILYSICNCKILKLR